MDIKAFYSKNKDVVNIFAIVFGVATIMVIARSIQKSKRAKDNKAIDDLVIDVIDPMDIEKQPTIENPSGSIKEDTPNDAVKCSSIITDYDSDFDYVKCDMIWYTRSKKNAKTVKYRNLYPNWTSLRNNNKAVELLNKKYPNF